MEMFFTPQFWVSVLQIIAIDLLLSGDNAVVIALACRNLPPEQRKKRGDVWRGGRDIFARDTHFFCRKFVDVALHQIGGSGAITLDRNQITDTGGGASWG